MIFDMVMFSSVIWSVSRPQLAFVFFILVLCSTQSPSWPSETLPCQLVCSWKISISAHDNAVQMEECQATSEGDVTNLLDLRCRTVTIQNSFMENNISFVARWPLTLTLPSYNPLLIYRIMVLHSLHKQPTGPERPIHHLTGPNLIILLWGVVARGQDQQPQSGAVLVPQTLTGRL